MRTKMVAGNWKMNKNLQEGVALATELKEAVKNPKCAVVIGTPFIHLRAIHLLDLIDDHKRDGFFGFQYIIRDIIEVHG